MKPEIRLTIKRKKNQNGKEVRWENSAHCKGGLDRITV